MSVVTEESIIENIEKIHAEKEKFMKESQLFFKNKSQLMMVQFKHLRDC